MPGVENYQRDPGDRLARLLYALGWQPAGIGIWEKEQSRLYVDSVGVFLYREVNGAWVRSHGLSHNLIHPRTHKITFKDFSTLNLLTGEWNGMGSPIS